MSDHPSYDELSDRQKTVAAPGTCGRMLTTGKACPDHPRTSSPEVIEDSSVWSTDMLNQPSGDWITHGFSYTESREEAARYARHLVDNCGVAKTRVTRVRTIITVEEVYPA